VRAPELGVGILANRDTTKPETNPLATAGDEQKKAIMPVFSQDGVSIAKKGV
jgi:hypothetical protein